MEASRKLFAPTAVPPVKNSSTDSTAGWVGPIAVLDVVGVQGLLVPAEILNPNRPGLSLVTALTVLSRLQRICSASFK
jgi:hypothetical protein